MGDWVCIAGWSVVSALKSQRDLTLENVALRHQLMVLRRQPGRLRLKDRDRPPQLSPPSQTWRSFLENHARDIVAIDFFVVPTATLRVLYVFLVMSHDRRRILNFNVTTSPSAQWTTQQIVEAFPYDSAPRYVLHDRDSIFAKSFARRVESMDIKEVVTAPGSPWQNPYCERLIGSIRRECLDHVLVLSERHLLRVLRGYASYYHSSRTHRSLDNDCPDPRPVEPPEMGDVVALAQVGGMDLSLLRSRSSRA
jgi:putative transposase